MKRRQFLFSATAGAAVAFGGKTTEDAKRARLAISSYCFYKSFPRTLDLLHLPEMFADRFHIHNLEVLAPHFASQEPSYLREVKAKLEQSHSRIVNVPIDIGELWDKPGLSAADEKERRRAVSLYKPWFDTAHAVGAQSVRCDPGKINRANLAPTIASYRELGAYAKSKDLYVIVENHFGVGSEHPEELVRILKEAGDQTGTLPDFGNFPDQATRERGLQLLFPLARTICHSRDTEGAGAGKLEHFDLAKCVRISQAAGYKGVYSIEAEADGDVYANVQHVYDELMKSF